MTSAAALAGGRMSANEIAYGEIDFVPDR